jgi:hypothetical protein
VFAGISQRCAVVLTGETVYFCARNVSHAAMSTKKVVVFLKQGYTGPQHWVLME